MSKKIIALLSVFLLNVISENLFADLQPETKVKKIYRFDIKEDIGPGIWRKVQKAINEANSIKADYIFVHLNTYGGMVDMADSIRSKFLYSTIPIIVFIDNNAASAGALISIACNRIYMRKGASIGAATVVNMSGEKMSDKYQSYMRSMMRSTAETRGRDAKIAEGMVDEDLEIKDIKEKGKVLTFTASEAVKHGYCEGIAETIEEVLLLEKIDSYEFIVQKINWTEKIIGFLINPAISGLLIMAIIAGIYFELQSPGIGFPLLLSVIAAVLYFTPHYLEGLAAHWEIFLFFMGIILLVVELLVFPGFGITGIAGILCVITALTFSLIVNDFFDFSLTGWQAFTHALFTVFVSLGMSVILSFILGKKIMKTSLFNKLVLKTEQRSSEGYSVNTVIPDLTNKTGVAVTVLRPGGRVEIEGEYYDANSENDFIERGEKVIVIRQESAHIVVRKIDM